MCAAPMGMLSAGGRPPDGDVLARWADGLGRRQRAEPGRGLLRFAFYGRVSTEDWQDPESSRARQLQQAVMLTAGRGVIAAEFFDAGQSRVLSWARRLQAAALVAQLADPDRGWDAIVVGEYERAFYGSQYASMAPLFEHYGVSLWMPEVGGRVDWHAEDHEQTMLALGPSSKREVTRTRPPARRVGQAGAPARTGPGNSARRTVDVRPAAGRAQRCPDHPRTQRRGSAVPVRI